MKAILLALLIPSASIAATSQTYTGGSKYVQVALDRFKADCGRYPLTEMGLEALLRKPPSLDCSHWRPYLQKTPYDYWNRPWLYESEGQTYVFTSLGADGHVGGEGKNLDIVFHSPK